MAQGVAKGRNLTWSAAAPSAAAAKPKGTKGWNTWAPAFAGDDCMFTFNFQHDMDEQAKELGWKEPQKVFHLFADAPATRTRGVGTSSVDARAVMTRARARSDACGWRT